MPQMRMRSRTLVSEQRVSPTPRLLFLRLHASDPLSLVERKSKRHRPGRRKSLGDSVGTVSGHEERSRSTSRMLCTTPRTPMQP